MYLTDDQEELMDAVSENDEARATRLLKKGVNPDFERQYDGSPLEAAIRNNNVVLVRALVDAGADMDRSCGFNDKMLDLADRERNSAVIRFLEQRGAASSQDHRLTLDQKALLEAVSLHDLDRVEDLLYGGLNPNFLDEDESTPLEHAIFARDPRVVAALAEGGADINRLSAAGESPLDLARGQGLPAITRYLENEGAKTGRVLSKKTVSKKQADPDDDYYDDDKYYFGADEGYRPSQKGKPGNTGATPVQKRPAFTEDKLAGIFDAQKWIGKPDEMQELWDKVPQHLQKHFDFAAAKAEARREMLKQNRPSGLKLPSTLSSGTSAPKQPKIRQQLQAGPQRRKQG